VEADNSKKGKRQLKIYSKHLQRLRRTAIVPEIRLCGKWLKEYGFHQGQSVIINCEEKKITIYAGKNIPNTIITITKHDHEKT
jgi:toxic protein SymE